VATKGYRFIAVGTFVTGKALAEVGHGGVGGLWEAEAVRTAFGEVGGGVKLAWVDGGLGTGGIVEELGGVVGTEAGVGVGTVEAGGLAGAGVGGALVDVGFAVGACVAGPAEAGVAGLVVDAVEELGLVWRRLVV